MRTVKRALVSVSDKTGAAELARALADLGVQILSTGGTASHLREAGIAVTDVSEVTGFPEIMGGRVKTLHPKIHGGLLGRRGTDDDVMAEHGLEAIDLIAVNLYPFEATVTGDTVTLDEAVEQIDIGGPAMLRAAAKNHANVAVVVDPDDYARVIDELKGTGGTSIETRRALATKAFRHTAGYDAVIALYLSRFDADGADAFPETLLLRQNKRAALRYGENPHQRATWYADVLRDEVSIADSEQVQGKELSYNNIADADAALECVRQFDDPACVIVKHANPSGVAVNDTILEAYERAYATDPTSAFGGIIAFNRPLDEQTARAIIERQFVEVIIAPDATTGAREAVSEKKNLRLLVTGEWETRRSHAWEYKRVGGGLLVQDRDDGLIRASDLKVVTKREPNAEEIRDLLFAWQVVKFVKSNAIVYAKDQATVGVGAGQMSRVYSARIAAMKAADAGLSVKGSVMASDAFFPFRDSIDNAAQEGVVAVIQPGGSIRDDEVIAVANKHGLAMVFTAMRHFRH